MKSLLASAIFFAAGGTALAQGAPAYNWSGFYVGGHAGFGWQDVDGIFDQGGAPGGPYDLGDFDVDGFVGGGHAGVNAQWNWAVVGIEGDVSFAAAEDTFAGSPLAGSTIEVSDELDLLASVRGRVGIAWNNLLVYGTAGVGYAEYEFTSTFTNIGFNPETDSVGSSDWGPAFGGGLEYGVGNLVLRVEGLHYDVESNFTFAGGEIPDADATDFIDWGGVTVIRGGASYKFNWLSQ